MILMCLCWSIFLCLALESTVKAQVTVDDQGYQNVLISFAPNFECEIVIGFSEAIKFHLERASRVLHKAIGIPIASATFLLPPSSCATKRRWNITITPASSEQTARRSDILVDGTEDSPFIKQPVALQHGGCGVPGHQIILNRRYMTTGMRYDYGKLLAREWLKHRYGVFEENGFPYDTLYPAYYRIPGKPKIRVTECTNSKVTYNFEKPTLGDVCDMDLAGFFGYCGNRDEKSSANVTSSLMNFHKDLPNMEHICGKDGRPHDRTAPNKQNALCNGRSIWDVVKSSEDFKTTRHKPAEPVPKSIKFSYVQESIPGFVVLLENSNNLLEKGKSILFALRRFYYDLPPEIKLAIYTYNSDVTCALPYTELPAEKRNDLGVIANFVSQSTSICTSCGLAKATEILLLNSEVEKGSILLITASPLDKVPEFPEKLKESGICIRVLRFTDEENPVDQSYDALANSSRCFSYESLQISLDVVNIFHALSRFLKNPFPEFRNFEIKTVASGNMSAQIPVTIPYNANVIKYTLWLDRALGSSSIECKAGEEVLTLEPDTTATDIASFTIKKFGYDEVTCRLGSAKQSSALTQVQLKTKDGHYFNFDIWIHDVSTDKEQLPIIIYAKVYIGGYPVKYANVTTVVTSGNRQEIVKMLDNGRGDPDITQFDGIYSGYFTEFLEVGDYQIRVNMNDNQGQAKIGKEYQILVPGACCGSKMISRNDDVSAFWMDKLTTYTAKNKRPEYGYPPSRILDLQARICKCSDKVILTWTAPGGEKAVRYVIKLFENRDDAVTKFDTIGRELDASSIVPGDTGNPSEYKLSFKDLKEDLTYYVTIRSRNEFNKWSNISNVAEFVPRQEETTVDKTSPTTASTTVAGSTTDGGITITKPDETTVDKASSTSASTTVAGSTTDGGITITKPDETTVDKASSTTASTTVAGSTTDGGITITKPDETTVDKASSTTASTTVAGSTTDGGITITKPDETTVDKASSTSAITTVAGSTTDGGITITKPDETTVDKASSTTASTTVAGSTTDGGITITITKPDETKCSIKAIEIFLGVLGGIAVLCGLVYFGYYFIVKKPRRN